MVGWGKVFSRGWYLERQTGVSQYQRAMEKPRGEAQGDRVHLGHLQLVEGD